jgi:hypothetical protein
MVPRRRVHFMLQEQINNFNLASGSRNMEGRTALTVNCLDIGMALNEPVCNSNLTLVSSYVERRHAVVHASVHLYTVT